MSYYERLAAQEEIDAEQERWVELREKHRADVDRDEGMFDLTDWDDD